MPPARMSAADIAADLADRIVEGEYVPGQQLPSYQQLADLYSVSYATVSRAILILRAQGVVYGEQGRGVFVANRLT